MSLHDLAATVNELAQGLSRSGEPRCVVVEVHTRDELAACAHAHLLEIDFRWSCTVQGCVQAVVEGAGREPLCDELSHCLLLVLVLQPGMGQVGDYGRDLRTGSADSSSVSTLFFPPAVSLTALALATTLAVAKPWGRIGSRRVKGS